MSEVPRRSDESAVLLAAAHSQLNDSRTARIVALLRQPGIDWDMLVENAWWQGVTPLVQRQLSAAALSGGAVPQPVLQRLEETARSIALGNLSLTADLIELLERLEARGIEAIPYKGPSLASRAYGDLSLRHFSDLDLLVRLRDMPETEVTCAALGYVLREPRSEGERAAVLRWGHHFSFVRDTTLVEMHWRFHKPLFGASKLDEIAWRTTRWIEMSGHRVRALTPELEVLVLATHASWHGWSQLSWVCDMAETAARSDSAAAHTQIEIAREVGSVRPLLVGYALAADLLDAAVPEAIAGALRDDGVARRAAAGIASLHRTRGVMPHDNARLQLALRERLTDKLGFVARGLLLPNPSDLQAVHLPAPLLPLHYAIRPFRIALRYRPRWLARSSPRRDGGTPEQQRSRG